MARPLAQFRFSHVSAAEKRLIGWTKPLLVCALQAMPTLCPPRVQRQSRDYLESIVRAALNRDDNDPIRLHMQAAIRAARAA